MTHLRKSIRQAIVTALTGETDAGDNVFATRIRPVSQETLPCICVYSKSESASIYQEAPRELERSLTVLVEIMAKADATLDDTLDDISEDVEHALMQDHTLGEVCRDIVLTGTEITIDDSGETLIGSAVLNYNVFYYTYAVADDSEENISDLDSVHVDWKDETAEKELAEDDIDLEE